jgi:hypothetical protein
MYRLAIVLANSLFGGAAWTLQKLLKFVGESVHTPPNYGSDRAWRRKRRE